MSEMVERVAKALYERWAKGFSVARVWEDNRDEELRVDFLDIARTAIAPMREPTEAMQDAGRDAITHAEAAGMRPAHKIKAGEAWRAMIDGALR